MAGTTRSLLEISYVIYRDGNVNNKTAGNMIVGTINGATYGYDPIRMDRAYAAEMDNYQRSYYTYSFYGVGSAGEQILEAVAIRRLNDRDQTITPIVAVDGRDTLGPQTSLEKDRVYLTPANWTAYLDRLVVLNLLTPSQRSTFASMSFTDATVQSLVETAFNQTLRTDISMPVADGLNLTNNNQTHTVDIDPIQDDGGFYLPKSVTVTRVETLNVVIPANYVSGVVADTEYQSRYDVLSGINQFGIWFAGFEHANLNVNEGSASTIADTVTLRPTRFIDHLTINTGDGADTLILDSTVYENLVVNAGSGADTILLKSAQGTTDIYGGLGNDDIRINYGADGQQTNVNGVTGTLNLRGGLGSDLYNVGMSGEGRGDIHILEETPTGPSDPAFVDSDNLNIYGSRFSDLFLFRPKSISTVETDAQGNFVRNGGAVRLSYTTDLESLEIQGNDGDDTFVFDDTSVVLRVFGGRGDDRFQIGQVFKSERDATANIVNTEDYFPTLLTTQGFLSNGISAAAELRGGDGNDTFTVYRNIAELSLYGEADNDNFLVRAFVRVNPEDPDAPVTNINGGQGADFISYTVNAPVNISGGDGLDTLTVVGTEYGEDFVVTEDGVYGGGLSISYDGIENLVLDAMSGNDRFYIAGTRDDVAVTLIGGQGSDTFNVGGGNVDANGNEQPIAVVSNDLMGHSGIIDHIISSSGGSGPRYTNAENQEVSVNVMDNEDTGVMLMSVSGTGPAYQYLPMGNGALRVFEDLATSYNALKLASYAMVLTRAPSEPVRILISPTTKSGTSGPEGIYVNNQLNGAVLVFDQTNWFKPQLVTVSAFDDTAIEGTEFLEIKHSAIEGNFAGDGDAYDNLNIRRVVVEVVDNDKPGVLISRSGDSNRVIERAADSESEATDTYSVVLTKAPTANVTITIASDDQTTVVGNTTLTFHNGQLERASNSYRQGCERW